MRGLRTRVNWYRTRLAAFERGEIAFRVGEALRRWRWKSKPADWRDYAGIGDGEAGGFASLRAALSAATPEAERFAGDAAALREGTLVFLGKPWLPLLDGDGAVDPRFWFHDPLTGRRWPGAETPAFSVPLRWTGETIGDVKFVWEPNRLQFLHGAAAHLALSGDTATREALLAVVRAWAAANPPARGVNWTSGIELSMRMVSLALVLAALDPATLASEDRILFRRLAAAHGRQLEAFPSRFSSANNHRIAEGLGLILCARMAPDLAEAPGWLRAGRAIVEQETLRQIAPDGVGLEQSPTYQAFVMEMIALSGVLLGEDGEGLSRAATARLEVAVSFLAALCDEALNVPAIGDDDEGRVIASPRGGETHYVAAVAEAVAGFLGAPERARGGAGNALRIALLGGDPAASAETPPESWRTEMQVYPDGGYTVVRDLHEGSRLHLVFDHGPLGFGTLAAHGHADALALWLSVDGTPVFVDAGTWLYHAGGEQRCLLREAAAHNTLTIAGRSPSQARGAFGWGSRADASFAAARTGHQWEIAGSHDGYRADFGAAHLRRVSRRPGGIAIVDTLEGAGEVLPVSLRFLLNPALDLRCDGRHATVSLKDRPLLRISAPAGFLAECRGAADGVVYSPSFGELKPGLELRLSGAALPRAVMETTIEAAAAADHVQPFQVVAGGNVAPFRKQERV
ncbi:MAG: alginate lyase family protein [Flavobacteriaceae bacterium]